MKNLNIGHFLQPLFTYIKSQAKKMKFGNISVQSKKYPHNEGVMIQSSIRCCKMSKTISFEEAIFASDIAFYNLPLFQLTFYYIFN